MPSTDAATTTAITRAEAIYQGYVTEFYTAAHTADYADRNLAKYLSTGPLSLSQHDLRTLSEHGAVELGTPAATILSATADLTATPPAVTLTACLDLTTVRVVYKSNQSPVPGNSPSVPRFKVTVVLQVFGINQWLIANQSAGRSTPC